MTETEKDEILKLFRDSFINSEHDLSNGELLSERDKLVLMFHGHFPELSESLKEIEKDNTPFWE